MANHSVHLNVSMPSRAGWTCTSPRQYWPGPTDLSEPGPVSLCSGRLSAHPLMCFPAKYRPEKVGFEESLVS
ncbi:unnamed protein product [Protopolystoma xenopodis]|uniref:Uncharacterized protein n=1 Tax=Protopolystoma xenopodis TaxID=117903 RepID=A0A3S4ZYK6_9PLAT|nr:unnamed protein product [Protopolystoma xenopodis]